MDLLAVQGTPKSLLQHHSSKASVLQRSAFFTVQVSHPYMTTGKTIALTRRTFVDKVMSLLFNMLSRMVITLLPRSKQKSSRIMLYVSLEAEPENCPKATLLFLDCFFLVSASPPSLIQFSSVAESCSTPGVQHTRLPCREPA